MNKNKEIINGIQESFKSSQATVKSIDEYDKKENKIANEESKAKVLGMEYYFDHIDFCVRGKEAEVVRASISQALYYLKNRMKEAQAQAIKEIIDYIMNNLYNHRKDKEELVSLQNMLCRDIIKHLKEEFLEEEE